MPSVTVPVSLFIPSPAQKIYAVVADYVGHHQQILPRQYFRTMVVEEGGVGAGTIFRADMEVYGNQSSFHMKVSEPQPGRVIQESDLNSDFFTTFTIEPSGATQSTVTITSQWERPAGLKSWLESAVRSWVMKRIYRAELAQLAQYVTTLQ
jgi:hypothetical protein